MSEFKQTCKQCGLNLPIDEFKKYASRSEGLRRTTTGRYTICKHCEKMSAYAAKINKRYESGEMTEGELAERAALIDYYTDIVDRGLPLVTKPVRVLMGVPDEPKMRRANSKVMDAIAEARRRMEEVNKYAEKCNEAVLPVQETTEGMLEALRQTTGRAPAVDPKEATAMLRTVIMDAVEQLNEQPDSEPCLEMDNSGVQAAADLLKGLLERELVREPAYYEAECDEALHVLRCSNKEGKVPDEYNELASKVLERLDEYADNYRG